MELFRLETFCVSAENNVGRTLDMKQKVDVSLDINGRLSLSEET